MCVLHVLAPGAVGGSERVVEMLATAQRARGFDARIGAVITERGAGPTNDYLTALDRSSVPVYRVTVGPRAYGKERRHLEQLLHDLRPQVVHTHGYRADVIDGAVAMRSGAAVVATAHGFTGGSVRNRCYEWLQRRSLRRFDAVVAVSRPMKAELARSGIDGARLYVIINAWLRTGLTMDRASARAALRLPEHPFVVGWVGRASREKGLDLAVRALAALSDLDVLLAVIGDGPQRRAAEAIARRLGVTRRVRWCGVVPAAATKFRALDAVLCSSRTEGTPVVLLEAMDAQVPIVTARVGGIPDLLTGAEATLVEPDNPDAMAAALRDVYAHRAAAARRAAAAHDRLLDERDARRWVDAYDDVYRAAMQAARMRL